MSNHLATAASIALLLCANAARADDASPSIYSFSGFGTLGAVRSSERQADFISTAFKPNGAGHSRQWSADVDSLIAAQASANLTPQLTAVLQVVSEQNYDNTYRPHLEWANLKYRITPDFDVRIGRTVTPVFLISDTRKVGYTYPWVRPPLEVYQLVPITHSDGLDLSYKLQAGEVTSTLQANAGKNELKVPNGGGLVHAKKGWGLSESVESGALTAHFAYQRWLVDITSLDPLFAGFQQFGPEGQAIADKYSHNGKPISFVGLGASYDPGRWFLMGEWGHTSANSFLGKQTAWYASSGYRFARFTPYITYARATADNLSDPGLTISALPPFLAGPAAALNAGLNFTLSSKRVQNTISVGGRWDLFKNTAFKTQFDHTRIGAGSNGAMTNLQPGFELGGKVNVFSATVDFIF